VHDADLVIEAVVEDLFVKRAMFAKLGRICRPGAVLATATSSLAVTELAAASGRPRDVLGMHFFNPAPAMRLVEISSTPATDVGVLGAAHALCARLGKTGVECADRTGFIVNYLLFPYLNRAIALLDDGVGMAELDTAVRDRFGYPLGPFALLDVIGLDVSLAIMRRLHDTFPEPDFLAAPRLSRLVAAGRLGRKSGGGFHPAR
jgi:3-hydroxybutyryl-CoA dehydrogenase